MEWLNKFKWYTIIHNNQTINRVQAQKWDPLVISYLKFVLIINHYYLIFTNTNYK